MRDKRIIVCDEKHGTAYWDATSLEAWATSSLAILTRRWNDGFWYLDPDNDGLGDSEWADAQRAERERAMALTADQIDALPASAAQAVKQLRARARQDTAEDVRHREWWTRAKACVEEQDLSLMSLGRRFEREIPIAWNLLSERSDHEYEGVSLEVLLHA